MSGRCRTTHWLIALAFFATSLAETMAASAATATRVRTAEPTPHAPLVQRVAERRKKRRKKRKAKRRRHHRKKNAAPTPNAEAAGETPTPAKSAAESPPAETAEEASPPKPIELSTDGAPLPEPPPLPGEYRAVALLPLHGTGVGESFLQELEQALFYEIEETDGTRAITPRDLTRDLEPFHLSFDSCDGEARCLGRTARYARAHLALATRVAALGGTINVGLSLIDTEKGVEVGRVAESLPEASDVAARTLHKLAVQLLAPETYVGSLTLNSAMEAADVYLDDRLVGTTPLPGPLEGLTAGPHILRVTKPGYSDLNRFVDVVFKSNTTITVDLGSSAVTDVLVETESLGGFGNLLVLADTEGIEIRVDGSPMGKTPLTEATIRVPTGNHRVSFRKPGLEPEVQSMSFEAGTRVDVWLTSSDNQIAVAQIQRGAETTPRPTFADYVPSVATAPVTGAPTPAAATTSWKWVGGLTALGLGAAGFAGWGYFGHQAQAKEQSADAALTDLRAGRVTVAEYYAQRNSLDADGPTMATRGWISLGAGAALVVTGTALLFWDLLGVSSPVVEPQTSTSASAELGYWGVFSNGDGGQFFWSHAF